MFTWIRVFLLYYWKIQSLFQKLKDQKLQTMQLYPIFSLASFYHVWDMGKQCKSRPDAANAASGQNLHCLLAE